jgi:nicotinate-nucleotide pyrophosphorylase (carboxylating)
VQELIDYALAEDVGAGDITSDLVVPAGARARARIEQKAPGVVAGLDVAQAVFERVDPDLQWKPDTIDGSRGDQRVLATVTGSGRSILTAERVALNLLGRLSGVATLTAAYVDAIAGTRSRILDTRKTTPGMRALEKRAVLAGGGHNHRAGLWDAVLVKENHSALAGGVGEATRLALAGAPKGMLVVIECATLAEVDDALAAGVTHVLADNMTLDELRETVRRCSGQATVEASGGVNLETIRDIAATGVDFISVGALTHSAPALDVSLTLEAL